uniref:Uncharacterized protein n=1 Tax=Myotis myotis TaxID=51298 RepID=A0A7J7ZZ46_MYOMY|nr:hypothetical protein mMyoMyo1_009870 [Myotis myotis]
MTQGSGSQQRARPCDSWSCCWPRGLMGSKPCLKRALGRASLCTTPGNQYVRSEWFLPLTLSPQVQAGSCLFTLCHLRSQQAGQPQDSGRDFKEALESNAQSLGIRIPGHNSMRDLAQVFGGPLALTRADLSSQTSSLSRRVPGPLASAAPGN